METIKRAVSYIWGYRTRNLIENHIFDKTINKSKIFTGKILPKTLYKDIFVIQGKMKDKKAPLTALFVGNEEKAHYLANFICSSENLEVKNIGKGNFSSVFSVMEKTKVGICLIAAERTLIPFLCKKGFFILPQLNFILDMAKPWEQIFESFSRRRRRDIKSVRNLQYSYEISKKHEKLAYFYYKMYIPFIRSRHGKSAMPRSIETLRDSLRDGGMLFINKDGTNVAGIFYQIDREEANMNALCFGINEKGDEGIKRYSSQITLLSLIDWAKKNKIKTLNYGITPPFLKDGLFTFKKEWGMRIEDANDRLIYAIKLCNFKDNVRQFMVENPFITSDSGRLCGVIFIENVEKLSGHEIASCMKRYNVPGMGGIILLSNKEISDKAMKTILEDFKMKRLRREEVYSGYCSSAFANLASEGLSFYEIS